MSIKRNYSAAAAAAVPRLASSVPNLHNTFGDFCPRIRFVHKLSPCRRWGVVPHVIPKIVTARFFALKKCGLVQDDCLLYCYWLFVTWNKVLVKLCLPPGGWRGGRSPSVTIQDAIFHVSASIFSYHPYITCYIYPLTPVSWGGGL